MGRVQRLSREGLRDLGNRILEHLEVGSGEPLVLIEGDDFVLVKKATSASPSEKFERLSAETRERFERLGIQPDDLARAVRWARESS